MEASQLITFPSVFTNYRSQDSSAPSTETLPAAQEQIKSFASMWQQLARGEILSAKDKKNAFIFDCKRLAETENLKMEKTAHSVRIATFNVHIWADPHFQWRKEDISPEFSALYQSLRIPETTKLSPIFDTIRALNADILLLQEAASDNNAEFEDYKRILQELGYTHGIQFFGNMNKDREVPYGPFGNWILSKFPFAQDPKVTYYTTQMEHTPEGEYVDRCVINGKIVLPNGQTVSVYNTHLDVFDHTEEVRKRQIQQLTDMVKEDDSDNILIAGDLNSVRPQDYSESLWNAIIQENQKRREEKKLHTLF